MPRRLELSWLPLLLTAAISMIIPNASASGEAHAVRANLWNDVATRGHAHVIVRFTNDDARSARLPRLARRARARRASKRVIESLTGTRYTIRRSFDALSAVALLGRGRRVVSAAFRFRTP